MNNKRYTSGHVSLIQGGGLDHMLDIGHHKSLHLTLILRNPEGKKKRIMHIVNCLERSQIMQLMPAILFIF